MSVEGIVAAIEAEAEARAGELIAAAQRSAEEILAGAEREARRVEDEAAHRRDEAAGRRSELLVNRAALEADRRLRDAREQVFQEAMRATQARLAELATDRDATSRLLDGLLIEAMAVLPEAREVRVLAGQVDLVRIGDGEVVVEGSLPDDEWGGLEVSTDDGRRVRNTLRSRFERAEPYLRLIFREIVFPAGVDA